MTNDTLQSSIAAALVESGLTFTTVVAQAGDAPIRLYQLTFGAGAVPGVQPADAQFLITMYSTHTFLVALCPVVISDAAKRREIAEALAMRMPMVRLLPPNTASDSRASWVEASVPTPPMGAEPVHAWLIAPLLVLVSAATQHILAAFAGSVSLPKDLIPPPFLVAARAEESAAVTFHGEP